MYTYIVIITRILQKYVIFLKYSGDDLVQTCIHVHIGAGVNSTQTAFHQGPPPSLVSFDVVTQVFDVATSSIQTMYTPTLP